MPCYGPQLYTSPDEVSGCLIPIQSSYNGGITIVPGFYLPLAASPLGNFFDIQGIYGQRFGRYRGAFDQLLAYQIQYSYPQIKIDPFNNVSNFNPVTMLNFQTQFKYQQQLTLFRKVYDYNYAAYYRTANQNRNGNPIYYRFVLASELSEFREANALVNKLYNVNETYPLQCIFFLPFPPFCNDTG
jgi:hypothetical protein